MSESRENHDISLFRIATESRAFVLLFALLFQILISAFDFKLDLIPFFTRAGTILAAVFMCADRKKHLVVGLSLGVPSLFLLYLTRGPQFEYLDYVTYAFVLALYLFILNLMLKQIFRAKQITLDTIGMALCAYVLIGSLWILFYTPVLALDPNAFSQPIGSDESATMHNLMYFSYVTLTTLGYGDISPVSRIARALAILEAVTGTLFIAVLISRLVGSYASSRRKD
jgi:hypothetical protein